VQNPETELPRKRNGAPDVGNAIGAGTVFMVRDLASGEPQTGTVEIVSGEIAEDIATYFAKSEQVPTLLSLGVSLDKDGSCLAAGGVLIQLLPFPDDATVDLIERNAASLNNISKYFEMGLTNEQILDIAMKDIPYDVFDNLEVEYKCDCSEDRMKKKILSLGKGEVKNLLDEQEAEGKPRELTAICRFCNSEYTYTEKDLLG
jgi:molecular chaperone Hsp33